MSTAWACCADVTMDSGPFDTYGVCFPKLLLKALVMAFLLSGFLDWVDDYYYYWFNRWDAEDCFCRKGWSCF